MLYIRALIFALSALLVCAPSVEAKVARIELRELVKLSDCIVVAQMESVSSMKGVRIARAVPRQSFNGTFEPKPFYFVAETSWVCNIRTAVKGETVLLFLNRVNGGVPEGFPRHLPSDTIGATPLFTIAYAGRGRMP